MTPLVSTSWLADHLGTAGLAILDASSHLPDAGRDAGAEFRAGHIPGARFLDLKTLIDPASAVPAALPTRAQFERRMGDLGVRPGDRVVLYDDSYVKTSARAWFICRLYGHFEVAILDGGLGKWRAEGRPLETGATEGLSCAFSSEGGAGTVRGRDEVLANIASGAEQLVDARGAARFRGDEPDFRPEVAAGHIPGSRNLPFDRLFNSDGTYRDEAGLRAEFAAAGVDLGRPVTTTCGSGVTAAVLLFALERIGVHQTALYDGSWSEWGSDPATPKALGDAA